MSVITVNKYEIDPVTVMEGATPTFAITLPGVTTVANDATMLWFIYKGSTDSTSTFSTGSFSRTNGPPAIITTKSLTGLKGGDKLHVVVMATMDGIYDCACEFDLFVRRKSGKN
jgi:hypothetical protein